MRAWHLLCLKTKEKMEVKLVKGLYVKKNGIQLSVNEIVEITYGTLLNQPSISFFNQICDDVQKIKKGDLFVARDSKDIAKAVQEGAFGILFSDEIAMSDSEVAWIYVENLDEALVRILRHYLIMRNEILFLLNSDEYELSHQILIPKKSFIHFDGSLVQLISYVLEGENTAYILYHNAIQLDFSNLPQFQQEIKELDKQKIPEESFLFSINSFSLFGMKIFYKSVDYSLPIPKLFLQLLARVLKFAEEYSLEADLEKLEGLSSFKPLYLDERGFISKPGATNKVVLACKDIKLYEQFLAYFKMYAKWARLMLFVPKEYQEIFTPYAEILGYETKEELFSQVLVQKYNFALVLGVETQDFEERFQGQVEEQNLFNLANIDNEDTKKD